MHSKNYYRVRSAVRFVFWSAAAFAALAAIQLFIIAVWSLQF